ncbi:hypothetical protein [Streptomyces sp. NPDC088762]|uniref:hypothetical protein n=1 Tax=Streptomyces sp. NPDC088762 TaxID=3365891 RepID=UPI003828E87E
MNINQPAPDGSPHWPVLLLVSAVAIAAAQNEVWTSALGSAAALYSVLATAHQDRRS